MDLETQAIMDLETQAIMEETQAIMDLETQAIMEETLAIMEETQAITPICQLMVFTILLILLIINSLTDHISFTLFLIGL